VVNISNTVDASQSLASLSRTLATSADGLAQIAKFADDDADFASAFAAAVALISRNSNGRLVICGVGKSGHIGKKIAATMASTGTRAFFVHPTEASHGDLGMIGAGDVILLLSWSGETPELANILTYSKRFGIPLIALTSASTSTLASMADIALILPRVREACPNGLAPTTSTLIQLLIGDALAISLLECRGFTSDDFRIFHPGGKLGAQLTKIGEIAHSGARIPLVRSRAPMSDAILEMSAKGFGVVGVLDDSESLVGIITDGDLRRHMTANMMSLRADQVMSLNPHTVDAGMLAAAVLKTLEERKITSVFIVSDSGRPDGFVHMHDLLRAGVA